MSFGRDRIISVANMYFNSVVYVTEDSYLATYNVMRLGDIAFEGNRSKRFAHGRFVENTIGDGIVSHVFKVFRPVGNNFDLSYWKHAINNEKLMKDVLTRSTKASTMMHELVSSDFLEESTLVPSLDEQRAIGVAIDSIDNLITLHQRKCQYRGLCGYLSWEQRKLGEVASEFQSGEFISATEITENGDYPVYGGNGLRGYANRYNHEGFYALIGRQGALCGNVNCADGKAYFTEHAVAVQANQCNDTGFLVYLLSRMNLGQYSGQSAQPGLAVSTLKEVETLLPSKHEQYRIGSLLKDLDSLITLHQ